MLMPTVRRTCDYLITPIETQATPRSTSALSDLIMMMANSIWLVYTLSQLVESGAELLLRILHLYLQLNLLLYLVWSTMPVA